MNRSELVQSVAHETELTIDLVDRVLAGSRVKRAVRD